MNTQMSSPLRASGVSRTASATWSRVYALHGAGLAARVQGLGLQEGQLHQAVHSKCVFLGSEKAIFLQEQSLQSIFSTEAPYANKKQSPDIQQYIARLCLIGGCCLGCQAEVDLLEAAAAEVVNGLQSSGFGV